MTDYRVYVTRDDRHLVDDYDMGLTELLSHDDIQVQFQKERSGEINTENLDDVDAIVLLAHSVSEEVLDAAENLKHIAKYGIGVDNIDLSACTERNIAVTNSPGHRKSVAQATLGRLIACSESLKQHDELVREVGFEKREAFMGIELFEKSLGLIGMGNIAKLLIDVVQPFDMDIRVFDPYIDPTEAQNYGAKKVDKETLLRTSDYLSIHCPLTDETAGLLDEESFQEMKETAYLVNTARGGIYEDKVLAQAVSEGQIAGAAVDVFENEPDILGNPLLEVDEILLTPHVAGVNRDGLTRVGEIASRAILSVYRGEVPQNIINPEALDGPIDDEYLSDSFF